MTSYNDEYVQDVTRKVLQKFSKNELADLFAEWSPLVETALSRLLQSKATKPAVISHIVVALKKKKVSLEKIGDLDLKHLCDHSKTKQWAGHYVQTTDKNWKLFNTGSLQAALLKELKIFCDRVEVNVSERDGLFWCRIHMRSGVQAFVPTNTLYCVYCPQSPVLLMTRMKNNHKDTLLQAFENVLNACGVKNLGLTGHCVHSLVRLALEKYSKECQTTLPPKVRELQTKGRKRRRTDEFENQEGIICENLGDKKRQLKRLEKSFGIYEQPKLEHLTYKVSTSYHGNIAGMKKYEGLFNFKADFKGRNVLEGLRNLGEAGLAKVPLPQMLTRVPTSARNHFEIGDRRKENDCTQTGTTAHAQ